MPRSSSHLRVWRSDSERCEIVAATPERAVEIGRKHLVGLTVRELRTWQEMRQEPMTEGVWVVLDGRWVKK